MPSHRDLLRDRYREALHVAAPDDDGARLIRMGDRIVGDLRETADGWQARWLHNGEWSKVGSSHVGSQLETAEMWAVHEIATLMAMADPLA